MVFKILDKLPLLPFLLPRALVRAASGVAASILAHPTIRMTPWASRLGRLVFAARLAHPTQEVLTWRDGFEVRGAHAQRHSAQMIRMQTFRYEVAVCELIRYPMRVLLTIFPAKRPVASVIGWSCPQPASPGLSYSIPKFLDGHRSCAAAERRRLICLQALSLFARQIHFQQKMNAAASGQ